MVKRGIIVTILLLIVLSGASTAWAVGDRDARNFIEDLAQQAITTVADPKMSESDRSDRLRQLFLSAFDVPKIGKFVLSRQWQIATPEQQTAFLKAFEDAQVLSWRQRFMRYNGEKLETQGAQLESEAVWLVDSQIIAPQGPPVVVQWRVLGAEDGSMRVIDIIARGVSMALTYRQDYASVLQSNGQSFDGLLATMRARNQSMIKKQ